MKQRTVRKLGLVTTKMIEELKAKLTEKRARAAAIAEKAHNAASSTSFDSQMALASTAAASSGTGLAACTHFRLGRFKRGVNCPLPHDWSNVLLPTAAAQSLLKALPAGRWARNAGVHNPAYVLYRWPERVEATIQVRKALLQAILSFERSEHKVPHAAGATHVGGACSRSSLSNPVQELGRSLVVRFGG